MPPKKDNKEKRDSEKPAEDIPSPSRNFLSTFSHLLAEWCKQSDISEEVTVKILKDGERLEGDPPKVVPVEVNPDVPFSVPPAQEQPPEEKEFSEVFSEEQLQNISLLRFSSEEPQRSTKIEIGLGFNKDGVLQKIRIEDTKLSPDFLKIFKNINTIFTAITQLHLIECNLKAGSIYMLGKYLQKHQSITDVTLDLNPVPEQNFHVIIQNTGVKHLSLRNCRIDCFGVKLIAKALTFEHGVVQNLSSLVLNSNSIHDEGFAILVQSFRCNATLQYLSVAKNMITDYGVVELSKVLQKFPLTTEENLERRYSYIKYLEKIDSEGLLDIMGSGSFITNLSSLTNMNENNILRRKKKKPMRMSSTNALETIPEISTLASPTDLTAIQVYTNNLHPLVASFYKEDGLDYSYGNFTLKYINLSYNWFGRIGIEALIAAAEYQQNIGPLKHGPGIMYIDIEERYPMPDTVGADILERILLTKEYPKSLDHRHLLNVAKISSNEKMEEQA